MHGEKKVICLLLMRGRRHVRSGVKTLYLKGFGGLPNLKKLVKNLKNFLTILTRCGIIGAARAVDNLLISFFNFA